MKIKAFTRKMYWESLWSVRINQLMGMPIHTYAWWKGRLYYIKKGEIK